MNYKQSALFVFLSFACAALLLGHIERMLETELLSPLSAKEYVTVEKEVERIVYKQPEMVEDKIRAVFGEHAEKAIKLLTCENPNHNSRAVNYNNDSRKTRDLGIFQINDYWQGIRHSGKADQFLFDPDINIQIAWILYRDSGYSFELWTCGRKMGI